MKKRRAPIDERLKQMAVARDEKLGSVGIRADRATFSRGSPARSVALFSLDYALALLLFPLLPQYPRAAAVHPSDQYTERGKSHRSIAFYFAQCFLAFNCLGPSPRKTYPLALSLVTEVSFIALYESE